MSVGQCRLVRLGRDTASWTRRIRPETRRYERQMQLRTTPSSVRIAVIAALWMIFCTHTLMGATAAAKKIQKASLDERSASAFIAEVRRSFTLNGKTIPPEIFRDFGDGDLADSGSIWVTVDLKAATGSNLYFDDIKQTGRWFSQKKTNTKAGAEEVTGYSYYGATENGLLVVLASYSGGGSGDFITLHILDIAAARAFDIEGRIYDRINLTNIRSVALGDRWNGEIRIEKNAIRVVTTRKGPADDSGKRETMTIEARRP